MIATIARVRIRSDNGVAHNIVTVSQPRRATPDLIRRAIEVWPDVNAIGRRSASTAQALEPGAP
jgi:hypothetical protein